MPSKIHFIFLGNPKFTEIQRQNQVDFKNKAYFRTNYR